MNYNSETETLLNFLGALRRQIIRSGKEFPTVVIDDVFVSINHMLDAYNYNGKYADDNDKNYK